MTYFVNHARHFLPSAGLVPILPACMASPGDSFFRIAVPVLLLIMALSIGAVIYIKRNILARWKELHRVEEQGRLIFNHAISGVALHEVVLDSAGRPVDYVFLDVNPAFEKQTGLRRSEILGRRATEVIAGIEKTSLIEIYGNVAITGNPVSFEPYLDLLDRHFFINAFRIGPGKFAVILSDVTERKQAEKERERNEARLRYLVDILQHPAETIQEFLDYALNQAIKLTESKIGYIYHYHEDRREFVLNTWSKDAMAECTVTDPRTCYELDKTGVWGEAVRQRRPIVINDFQAENSLKKGLPGGHVKLARFMTVPIFQGKEIVGVLGLANKETDYTESDVFQISLLMEVVWKITERKRVGEALRDSEIRLRAITGSAQDAILMMEPNGTISYWNPAAETIFGYRAEEAVGKDLHKLLAPERYLEKHYAALPEFIRAGRGNAVGKTIELSAMRKDGREIDVALSLSAVLLDGAWHAVGILRDITEIKQAQEDLISANRQLEEATIRANDMAAQAEMASIAKSEFLANMSHEIRTPLNGVIGMAGFLLDTALSKEQRHYAGIIRSGGESLLGLINDILDFSKIEAKKLDLEILDFDLSTLLDDFVATMALRAHEKGLELIACTDAGVPVHLRGDPGRLRQILTNLTGNAIKFTHTGEVAIRVSLLEDEKPRNAGSGQEEDNGILLRFSVRDTGIGIPEDKIFLLFKKFSQVDASTTRKFGGTGLGLAISKQLTEIMGGEIGVNSEPDKGSEFWFSVRFEKQPEASREKMPAADLRGVRTLVVDDNATNREILVTQMASWDMRPSAAENGPAALQALVNAVDEKDPFRVAVIDMQMPGMDGEGLGRAIAEDGRLKGIRKVMMTSLGVRGDARRFAEMGFDAYLTKPARRLELRSVLTQVLGGKDETTSKMPRLVTRHTAREALNLFEGSRVRILLAEDNLTNRQVALGLLGKLGLSADAVADGTEVMKALASIPYDLVLMDVQMPAMDGLEATRQIRNPQSAVKNKEIPIIAMTAHAIEGDRERCLEAGMNGYVSKPVSLQSLAEALEPWVVRKAGGGGASDPEADVRGKTGERRFQRSISSPDIFDRRVLLDRLAGDEALTERVVTGFLEDIPKQLAALRKAVWQEKAREASAQAHKIKGAAANIGGELFYEAALSMEKAGKAGDLPQMKELMPRLERRFDQLRKAMASGQSLKI